MSTFEITLDELSKTLLSGDLSFQKRAFSQSDSLWYNEIYSRQWIYLSKTAGWTWRQIPGVM